MATSDRIFRMRTRGPRRQEMRRIVGLVFVLAVFAVSSRAATEEEEDDFEDTFEGKYNVLQTQYNIDLYNEWIAEVGDFTIGNITSGVCKGGYQCMRATHKIRKGDLIVKGNPHSFVGSAMASSFPAVKEMLSSNPEASEETVLAFLLMYMRSNPEATPKYAKWITITKPIKDRLQESYEELRTNYLQKKFPDVVDTHLSFDNFLWAAATVQQRAHNLGGHYTFLHGTETANFSSKGHPVDILPQDEDGNEAIVFKAPSRSKKGRSVTLAPIPSDDIDVTFARRGYFHRKPTTSLRFDVPKSDVHASSLHYMKDEPQKNIQDNGDYFTVICAFAPLVPAVDKQCMKALRLLLLVPNSIFQYGWKLEPDFLVNTDTEYKVSQAVVNSFTAMKKAAKPVRERLEALDPERWDVKNALEYVDFDQEVTAAHLKMWKDMAKTHKRKVHKDDLEQQMEEAAARLKDEL